MKRDIYNHKERYENWKAIVIEEGIEGLSKDNSDIIIQYVLDMEQGLNIGKRNKKGARSYPRLNNIKQRMIQMTKMLNDRGVKKIIQIKEEQIISFFTDMRNGKILTTKGEPYRSVGDYAKVFTAFWHWHMKVNRKKDIVIQDICEDLDKSYDETSFVYVTKEQIDKIIPYFDEDEQIIIKFVYDSIIRSPTELMSEKVKYIYKKDGDIWVHVPGEVSKTGFDRDFNLLYCGDALMKYIEKKELSPEDFLFNFSYPMLTRKLRSVAKQVLGDKISHPKAGGKYSELTLYDLRHSGAIHLRILAKKTKKISLDAIRQRGGWKDFKMLNYYTKFIGLDGAIDKNDLVIEEDKSQMQKELDQLKGQVENLKLENSKVWDNFQKSASVITNFLNEMERKKPGSTTKLLKDVPRVPKGKNIQSTYTFFSKGKRIEGSPQKSL